MREAIKNRVSKRTFTKEALTGEQFEQITDMVKVVNEKSGLKIELIEDGSKAFSSVRKTYGLFKNVRSMLLMKGNPNMENFREKIGYYGERLILDIVEMGLGTCWVGGTFDRETFTIADDEYINDVILIGNVDKLSVKEKLLLSFVHKGRKPVHERISADMKLPEWIENGMEAVVLAPSALNKQKPHFYYKEGILTADVPDDYAADLTDLGIAKLHFEIGAEKGRFELGNGGRYIMD